MATITLERVDVPLLEQQRKTLSSIERSQLTEPQADALDGIQNMLDEWSDNMHRIRRGVRRNIRRPQGRN